MALLTVQKPSATGVAPSFVAAAGGGDSFPNDGRTFFYCKNASGGAITVTLNSLTACNQGSDHDYVVSVGAGVDRIIGPFDVSRFNDGSGNVGVTYSGVTSFTVAAFSPY